MGWYRRWKAGPTDPGPSSRLKEPTSVATRLTLTAGDLEEFGRYSIRKANASQAAVDRAMQLLVDTYPYAAEDPARFCADLRRLAEPPGGWASYGATHLIHEMLGGSEVHNSDYDALMQVSMAFLRSRWIPRMYVNGREEAWWSVHREPNEDWLVGRPAPSRESAIITPLAPDEVRRVAHMGPSANSNDILVKATDDNRFESLIEGPYSEEDPRLSRYSWHSADTLYDLYLRVSEALGSLPPWCDPELEEFIPLPLPDFT